jgi:ABC-type multidrug transport system fused ATPase/permease subunit
VTIAEVLRQVWKRLAHKQWLIFYSLALAIINTLAFLAVYSAAGGALQWSRFFATNYAGQRWQFIADRFIDGLSFTPALGIAVFVGLAACVFAAMLRAPLFRAIVGYGYPLTPRSWEETARLALFYLVFYLILVVLPFVVPAASAFRTAIAWIALVVNLFLIYTDYVIVFEGVTLIPAIRRSARLLARRWPPALALFVVWWIINLGLDSLYSRYYEGREGVFLLIPLSQVLVFSFFSLLFDLLFIFLYERARQSGR